MYDLDFVNADPKKIKVSLHKIIEEPYAGPIYHAGVDTIDAFCKSWFKELTEKELDEAYLHFCKLHPGAAQGGSGGAGQHGTSEEQLPERTPLEQEVIKMMQEDVPGHDYYNQSKKATLELLQRGLTGFGENEKVVDPAARMEEWSEFEGKCKGLRKGGKKHGICRTVDSIFI